MPLPLKTDSINAIESVVGLAVDAAGDYPMALPQMDPALQARFPALGTWQRQMDAWWFHFRTVLQRHHLEAVAQPIKRMSEELAALKTSEQYVPDTFDTRTHLRADTGYFEGRIIVLLGRTAAYDGGGGLFVYDDQCMSADDGSLVIKPGATPLNAAGRYRRISAALTP